MADQGPLNRVGLDFLVRAFSAAMLAKLYANEHKPGWQGDDPRDLIRRLEQEVGELRAAVGRAGRTREIADPRGRVSKLVHGQRFTFRDGGMISIDPDALETIRAEAADVANFAMMVADRCAQLAREAPVP